MLKLEKATYDRKITIIVRDKEYFLTHSFQIAFAFALGLHLLFLLVFHIAPFTLQWGETIFPPVQVEADTIIQDSALMVDVNQVNKIPSGLPATKPSLPILSEAPTVSTQHHMEYLKEKNNSANPFLPIEKDLSSPVFSPLIKQSLPPMRIVISGPLGKGRFTVADEVENKLSTMASKVNSEGGVRLVFDVLVDGRSGRICWYEPRESSPIDAMNRFGESVLHAMLFAANPEAFMVAGEVEMHFIPASSWKSPFGLRESSRGWAIVSCPILEIWGNLRSSNPGALAQSKWEFTTRGWYNLGIL